MRGVIDPGCLTPSQQPESDEAAASLRAALEELRIGDKVPRDAALGAFRRHLGRIQKQVRDDFETYRMAGVEAARSGSHP